MHKRQVAQMRALRWAVAMTRGIKRFGLGEAVNDGDADAAGDVRESITVGTVGQNQQPAGFSDGAAERCFDRKGAAALDGDGGKPGSDTWAMASSSVRSSATVRKTGSRDPKSTSMAALTVAVVESGPGVNSLWGKDEEAGAMVA